MSVVKLEMTYPGRPVDQGTGFVVQYGGGACLIMTNRHVIQGASAITVVLPGQGLGHRFPGATVQKSGPSDLALIRLDNADGEFQPMSFAELPIPRLTGVVYCHGFFHHEGGTVLTPGRFPGQITGVYDEDGFQYLDGTFGSDAGTSGGPITMGNSVIGVNQAQRGGSRCVLSLQAVYMTLMSWCNLNGGNHTIAKMLRRLAA
ncbi:hypothetical protein ACQ4PT_020236 [Festuca glaucescens]